MPSIHTSQCPKCGRTWLWRTTGTQYSGRDSSGKRPLIDDTGDSGLYTIDEIFHNKENGLFNVYINPILRHKGFIKKDWRELKDSSSNQRLYYYLKLISDRAAGRIPTLAKFLREFTINHPTYKHDSKVTGLINYDMILMAEHY